MFVFFFFFFFFSFFFWGGGGGGVWYRINYLNAREVSLSTYGIRIAELHQEVWLKRPRAYLIIYCSSNSSVKVGLLGMTIIIPCIHNTAFSSSARDHHIGAMISLSLGSLWAVLTHTDINTLCICTREISSSCRRPYNSAELFRFSCKLKPNNLSSLIKRLSINTSSHIVRALIQRNVRLR